MQINPSQIIGYSHSPGNTDFFYGYNPASGQELSIAYSEATRDEIDRAVVLARNAFWEYRKTSAEQKSSFLESIARHIELLGDDLLQLIHEETALPLARLTGERARTTGQLRLFAQLLKEGKWNQQIEDEAMPERKPIPRPRLIQKQVPIGPVAIFGASNFPLAFSVAGGDTAAALAAGCPVVFKAHPAHPSTCQVIGSAISEAAKENKMPDGVFSLLHGISNDVGEQLVTHPLIRAVAFTGSFKGGKALFDLGVRRKEPIPVYAEMGSVNPVFILPDAIKLSGEMIAGKLAQSVALGSGQFCTNPGVCILIDNPESRKFIRLLADSLSAATLHPMLSSKIAGAYHRALHTMQHLPGAEIITAGTEQDLSPQLTQVAAKEVFQQPAYFEEVFGPATVAILADGWEEMLRIAELMPGQLTGTIHASEKEFNNTKELIEILTYKAGRVLLNDFPTGVEVASAMVHGGPYPATTDSRVTSVGTHSIYRFTRPVCYQNIADSLLGESKIKSN